MSKNEVGMVAPICKHNPVEAKGVGLTPAQGQFWLHGV